MKGSPYVGPRPYERGDQKNFYGREREARELQALLTAEREVLVYATSGAGKTSLFNARVIPALEEQGFLVLPVARVGMDLPPEIQPGEVKNIFILSTLLSLAGESVDPLSMLDDELPVYVQSLLVEAGKANVVAQAAAAGTIPAGLSPDSALADLEEVHPPILIFDQFEELFTTHRERWEEAGGFFEQVRRLMDAVPGLGVVFSMREDHVAALDPFLPIFPNRLRARFRLEPLGQTGALAAIARPAKTAGLPFAPGVAERLVDDLRRIKVQVTGKEEETALGPFVEPVQLQVVCTQLWASLPDDKLGEIQWEEVQQYGNVDRALTNFYETCVLRAAALLGGIHLPPDLLASPGMPGLLIAPAHERRVRTWVSSQLITPVGTRGLALRGPEETAGLPNEIVDVLEDLHMVRAEVRAGARWYELAHDRLVDPVLASNRAWEKSRETPLRTAARRWKETGDASLLYRGNALHEVKAMLQVQEERPITGFDFEPYELEFYQASLKAEQAVQRRRRQLIATIIGVLALLALMAALTVFAFRSSAEAQRQQATAQRLQVEAEAQRELAVTAQSKAEEGQKRVEEQNKVIEAQKKEADQQALRARGRELASYASSVMQQGAPQRAMLLAMQGLRRYQDGGGGRLVSGEQVLRDALNLVSGVPLRGQKARLSSLVPSPDGRLLAAYGEKDLVYVWDVSGSPDKTPIVFQASPRDDDWILRLAIDANNRWLVGSGVYTNNVWDLQSPGSPPFLYNSNSNLNPSFLPGGRWLLTWGIMDPVMLWDIQRGRPFEHGLNLGFLASDVKVDPNGRWLFVYKDYTFSMPYQAMLWDLQAPDPNSTGMGISVGAEKVVLADFSPDGRWLAVALTDENNAWKLRFYDLTASRPLDEFIELPYDFRSLTSSGKVTTLAFHSSGNWLITDVDAISGKSQHFTDFWDLQEGVSKEIKPTRYFDPQNNVSSRVQSSPDGCWIGLKVDSELRLYRVFQYGPQLEKTFSLNEVNFTYAFSQPDQRGMSRYLAIADNRNIIQLADLDPNSNLRSDCTRDTESPVIQEERDKLRVGSLGGLDSNIAALSFLPGDHWLAAIDDSGDARVWPLPVKDWAASPIVYPQDWSGFSPYNPNAIVTPDQKNLLLISGGTLITWHIDQLDSAPQLLTIPTSGRITSYSLSSDGRFISTIEDDGSLYVWDLSRLGEPADRIRRVIIDKDNDHLDMRTDCGFIPGTHSLICAHPTRGVITRIDLDKDGAAAGQKDFYNTKASGLDIRSTALNDRWLAALMKPAGRSGTDSQFYFWDVKNLAAPPLIYPAPEAGPMIQFSPDGSFLATLDTIFMITPVRMNSSPLKLWDVRNLGSGQNALLVKQIWHPSGYVATYGFSPDGRWLATGMDGGGTALWNLEKMRASTDAEPYAEFYSTTLLNEENTTNFIFSDDGRWLAGSTFDNRLYLWDLQDLGQGAVVLRPPSDSSVSRSMAFLPGNSAVIAFDYDGDLMRWPIKANDLFPLACAQVNRELTAAEQQQYLQGETPLQVCPIQ